ncbi:unnamed protein product [Owenia fusiformis]|uniref:Uncharacterized protein n=1 Tax=Owenia fusiformis TaxID=6347 RepID=A0A8J1UCM3_OWEFU|nr:unnamed protein product [Owenia fusiformis]
MALLGGFGGASKKKGASGKDRGSREMLDRRPLKSLVLQPPHYVIDRKYLHEAFVEKEIRFAGIVGHIPITLDTTNRTDILRIIDKAKSEGRLPWTTSYQHDAIFTICSRDVKITSRDEEVLKLRLPITEISSMCYIRDDDTDIMGMLYGNPDDIGRDSSQAWGKFAFFYCDSRRTAEEICALCRTVCDIVYEESRTRDVLEDLDNAIDPHENSSFSSYRTSDPVSTTRAAGAGFISQSHFGDTSTISHQMATPERMRSESESSHVTDSDRLQQENVIEYTNSLTLNFTNTEIKNIAETLGSYLKQGARMPVQMFCETMMSIFGESRKKLLADLEPFVPAADEMQFKAFLDRHGLGGHRTVSSSSSRHFRRTLSNTSNFSDIVQMDEFDRTLHDISAKIEKLEMSVEKGKPHRLRKS